ncbi:MAG: hypothetical protein NC122_03500 [Faecalibacterium sp.]|nr:hypothetical protein [Ruminococcus sp.]MCM1391435.1 hypothetical protein [Ruminococcus sp.]MCM1485250.1 hypothetical protein [Faecalibacterium sp.]
MFDNDMKIYSKGMDINTSASIAAAFEKMNLHRANGNLQKARELGTRLATITPSLDGDALVVDLKDVLAPKFLAQDILYQIKVLLVFAAESSLQIKVPTEQLATTAISSLYNSLEKLSPGFFKNISDGAAFTFYYLALKKGGDISKNIGEAFAMLCSVKKSNESVILAGETVWNLAIDIIGKEISKTQFEKI